mgnify:CR=1 FL=1
METVQRIDVVAPLASVLASVGEVGTVVRRLALPEVTRLDSGRKRNLAEAIGQVGIDATAFPEAEFLRIKSDKAIKPATKVEVLVARARKHVLIISGEFDVDLDTLFSRLFTQAAPVSARVSRCSQFAPLSPAKA